MLNEVKEAMMTASHHIERIKKLHQYRNCKREPNRNSKVQ